MKMYFKYAKGIIFADWRLDNFGDIFYYGWTISFKNLVIKLAIWLVMIIFLFTVPVSTFLAIWLSYKGQVANLKGWYRTFRRERWGNTAYQELRQHISEYPEEYDLI